MDLKSRTVNRYSTEPNKLVSDYDLSKDSMEEITYIWRRYNIKMIPDVVIDHGCLRPSQSNDIKYCEEEASIEESKSIPCDENAKSYFSKTLEAPVEDYLSSGAFIFIGNSNNSIEFEIDETNKKTVPLITGSTTICDDGYSRFSRYAQKITITSPQEFCKVFPVNNKFIRYKYFHTQAGENIRFGKEKCSSCYMYLLYGLIKDSYGVLRRRFEIHQTGTEEKHNYEVLQETIAVLIMVD